VFQAAGVADDGMLEDELVEEVHDLLDRRRSDLRLRSPHRVLFRLPPGGENRVPRHQRRSGASCDSGGRPNRRLAQTRSRRVTCSTSKPSSSAATSRRACCHKIRSSSWRAASRAQIT
jgi:hypothetical protein